MEEGSCLAGVFDDLVIQGKGIHTFEDGLYTVGEYVDGILNG